MVIIEELYFALPIYICNMVPVFMRKIPFLGFSINKRLFGENKTIRGFLSAIITCMILFSFQKYLYRFDLIKEISLVNYYELNILLIGFLAGFGAITGDLVKSFFKRRKNIKPGEAWVPFDQLDFIIGALILIYPFVNLSLGSIFILLIITPILHISANHVGYYLKIKDTKW